MQCTQACLWLSLWWFSPHHPQAGELLHTLIVCPHLWHFLHQGDASAAFFVEKTTLHFCPCIITNLSASCLAVATLRVSQISKYRSTVGPIPVRALHLTFPTKLPMCGPRREECLSMDMYSSTRRLFLKLSSP